MTIPWSGTQRSSFSILADTRLSASKRPRGFLNSGEVANTYCLITDQQLPGMSGTDLQKHLREAGYRTPVIFITAYLVPTVRERALAAGAVAFLTKPFDDAVLVDCLQNALSTRQHQSAQRRF